MRFISIEQFRDWKANSFNQVPVISVLFDISLAYCCTLIVSSGCIPLNFMNPAQLRPASDKDFAGCVIRLPWLRVCTLKAPSVSKVEGVLLFASFFLFKWYVFLAARCQVFGT